MRGFTITTADGRRHEIEATRYEIAHDGSAHFFVDDAELVALPMQDWERQDWERIDQFGTPLSQEWPSVKLDYVLANLAQTLGVKYGKYVHRIGSSSKYSSGYFNDLGALTAALLAAVDLDHSSDDPAVPIVLGAVIDAFHVMKPLERVEPSGFMTQLHCPRCGDTLFELPHHRRALECKRGGMELSEVMSDWLREFAASLSSVDGERASTVNWGGTWFCAADGRLMSSSDHVLPKCGSCSRILPARLIYHLIEFQGPHR